MFRINEVRSQKVAQASALILNIVKRHKKKRPPKVTNSMRALEYFDISYAPVYGTRWPSVRLALLSKQKYVAVINNFSNFEETTEKFQELGAEDIRHRYSQIKQRMLARQESNAKSADSVTHLEISSGKEGSDTNSTRPSLIQLNDDELAAKAIEKQHERYPEEYRLRAAAQQSSIGDLEVDADSRVIYPSGTGRDTMMDYVPATRLKGLENWMEETDVFMDASQGDQDIGVSVEKQLDPINLPEMLKIFSFEKGNISNFPQPRIDPQLRVLNYYAMDGASLLPILALDLQAGDRVLDLCAAPGGKSLMALQTLMPALLVSNDVSEGRTNRIKQIFKQYVPKDLSSIERIIAVTQTNGCRIPDSEVYDKVLVDVPCITDRHSATEDDNNIFHPMRAKERLRLPDLQSDLLVSALKAVRPGGTVVYSTCTMSPLQNDGAVHLALSKIWQETTIECSVVDLSYAIQPLNFMYRFGHNLGLRYGQIVLPSLLANFGPMYFAKIKRLR